MSLLEHSMDTLHNECDALVGRRGSRLNDAHAVLNDETLMTTSALQVKENTCLKVLEDGLI
jgi:hypothetical protein